MAKYKSTEVTPFTGEVPAPSSHKVPTGKLGRQNRIAAQLLGIGYSVEEVSRDTGLEIAHLRVLLKSHLFRTEMDRAQEKFIKAHVDLVREAIYAKGPRAVEVVEEIMDDPKHKDRLGAAKEVLGRIVPLKQEGGQREPVVVIQITQDKLESYKQVMAEYSVLEDENGN